MESLLKWLLTIIPLKVVTDNNSSLNSLLLDSNYKRGSEGSGMKPTQFNIPLITGDILINSKTKCTDASVSLFIGSLRRL